MSVPIVGVAVGLAVTDALTNGHLPDEPVVRYSGKEGLNYNNPFVP